MYLKELLQDTRELMYPYTALKLKEQKKNTLKDFISVAGTFGVTHMIVFSQTEKACYMRVIKNPRGPTLTFKIDDYSLAKDVIKYQQSKRYSKIFSKELQNAPLLIMNGFGNRPDNDAYKIVSLMI
jgi:ribosome biogenesis protein SSF1/2